MARVLVLGNAGLDISLRMPRLPERGETLLGRDASRAPGGKGLNQAVCAARAGVETLFQAPVGEDGTAVEIEARLALEACLTFKPSTMRDATDLSLLMVLPDGENSIVSAGSCAAGLTPDTARAFAEGVRPGDIFLAQGNLSLETTRAAFERARKGGARTMFNPAPVWWDAKVVLPSCDVLIVNSGEAEALSGKKDTMAAAEALCGYGAGIAIVTLGGEGCLVRAEGVTRRYAALPVDMRDTTGCGDTFCGTLAAGLCLGMPLEEAVSFAQSAAAITATRMGAFAALPQSSELTALRGMRG